MTIENIFGTERTVRDLLPNRQTDSSTSFADILSKSADLQSLLINNRFKLSDSLRVPHAIVEKRPACIICGMTISEEGTCLCEYPTVLMTSGINLKRNAAAAGASAQPEAAAVDKPQTVPDDNIPRDTEEDIKLRHKCPICGTVTDDGNCGCDASKKNLISKSAKPKPITLSIN